jgi:hypothetical protein
MVEAGILSNPMNTNLFQCKASVLFCALLSFTPGAARLQSQTVSVSSEAQLVAAINDYNAGTVSTIEFANSIDLTAALPVIDGAGRTLTINGEGNILRRSSGAATNFRILTNNTGNLNINDLGITNGVHTSGAGLFVDGIATLTRCDIYENHATSGVGGGIASIYNLTLNNCRIYSNSSSTQGGGVANVFGTVTMRNTSVYSNTATLGGGGLFNREGTMNVYGSAGNSIIVWNEAPNGGGVYNYGGELTLSGVEVSSNEATGEEGFDGLGGGILSDGTVSIDDCVFSGNQAVMGGGGIVNEGNMILTSSTIGGLNTAQEGGGIVNLPSGTLTVSDCAVSGNQANQGGGGFVNMGEAGLYQTTIEGNQVTNAEGLGGGIGNGGRILDLINCTVSGNSCLDSESDGGGLMHMSEFPANLRHSTFSNNHAGGIGGGILSVGPLSMGSCLITGNTSGESAGVEFVVYRAPLENLGYNVLGHNGLTSAQAFGYPTPNASDVLCTSDGGNPQPLASILSPTLANNGGYGMTHALVPGSPAIDIAPATGVYPATDQRGVSRPLGAGLDAGSFEWGTIPDPIPASSYEEFTHHLTANTVSAIAWNLDPNGILGSDPAHSIASGSLPAHLGFEGFWMKGFFKNTGTYQFTVVSRNGLDEVRNHFIIQVIPPTLTPFIKGLWVNSTYQPTMVMQERTHGDAAITELINLVVKAGQPLNLTFDWDFIKGDYSFRVIRGSLPAGLSLRETVVDGLPTAIIEGTPTTPGESIFVVSVRDWRERGYQWIRLVVE